MVSLSTPYTNIFSRFSIKVQDYTLDSLYTASTPSYNNLLLGWLKSAIPKFSRCVTNISLSARDDVGMSFTNTLTETEEEILSLLMRNEWIEKEVGNILEMRSYMGDSDFRRYSEANNLKEKRELKTMYIEESDRMIVQYTFDNYNWSQLTQ